MLQLVVSVADREKGRNVLGTWWLSLLVKLCTSGMTAGLLSATQKPKQRVPCVHQDGLLIPCLALLVKCIRSKLSCKMKASPVMHLDRISFMCSESVMFSFGGFLFFFCPAGEFQEFHTTNAAHPSPAALPSNETWCVPASDHSDVHFVQQCDAGVHQFGPPVLS